MSAANTFRKVRHEFRKWGIDLDWLGPLCALAAGALAGLLAWYVLSTWFLDYRAEVELKAGPQSRSEDATRALIDRVEGRKFQDAWLEAATAHDRLCSHGQLQVALIKPEEGEVHLARLVCSGRPRGSARLALARARDALTDPSRSGISPLLPLNHAKRVEDVRQRKAEAKKADDLALAERDARLEALRKVTEKKNQAQKVVGEIQKKIDATDAKALAARRRDLVDQRAKLASPIDGPVALTEAEQQKLRDEYSRLERLFRADGLRDCTADHPVVRRMNTIARQLKLADLDKDIAAIDKKLDSIKPLEDESDTAKAALKKVDDEEKQAREDLRIVSERQSQTAKSLSDRDQDLKALASVPGIPVEVAATGGISDVVEREWLFWPCLGGGLVVGLALMILLRLRTLARHSHINSSSGLAHCLHVPVLGVVPDLGSVAPQQE